MARLWNYGARTNLLSCMSTNTKKYYNIVIIYFYYDFVLITVADLQNGTLRSSFAVVRRPVLIIVFSSGNVCS